MLWPNPLSEPPQQPLPFRPRRHHPAQFEVQPPFARCHYPLATVTGSADGDSRSDADYSLLNGKAPHPAATTTTH